MDLATLLGLVLGMTLIVLAIITSADLGLFFLNSDNNRSTLA